MQLDFETILHFDRSVRPAKRRGCSAVHDGATWRLDGLCGLLGMIEVVDGRRAERADGADSCLTWEGWILGQTESAGA